MNTRVKRVADIGGGIYPCIVSRRARARDIWYTRTTVPFTRFWAASKRPLTANNPSAVPACSLYSDALTLAAKTSFDARLIIVRARIYFRFERDDERWIVFFPNFFWPLARLNSLRIVSGPPTTVGAW